VSARRHLAVSLTVAAAAELVTGLFGGLGTPTRWAAAHLAAAPAPAAGPAVTLTLLAVLTTANSIAAARMADPDAPPTGRVAVGLVLGAGLTIVEGTVLAVVWLALQPG
jgi:hypothetical protein